MTQKLIETGVYGITVSRTANGSGTIRSELRSPGDGPETLAAIDALEGLILAHACSGVDIGSPAYLEGIETAVDAIFSRDWEGRILEEDTVEAAPQAVRHASYSLAIDGPTFRSQRELLLKLQGLAGGGIPYTPGPSEKDLLEGLIELTDQLADQAHDRYGVECLLDVGEEPCECEKPGYFHSGIPGILAHMEDGRLAPGAKVERCDLCQRYPTDDAALEKVLETGYGPP